MLFAVKLRALHLEGFRYIFQVDLFKELLSFLDLQIVAL
jgi:hypothetical protein